MTDQLKIKNSVLIAGESRLVSSLAVCLLQAKQPVTILTAHYVDMYETVAGHAAYLNTTDHKVDLNLLNIVSRPLKEANYLFAILVTEENLEVKRSLIKTVEALLGEDRIIAINTESIALSDIQHTARHPQRIIGANWVEPVHTTFFLELLSNQFNKESYVTWFSEHAKTYWQKDPYIVNGDHGIRARLFCAMIREAFHLVENGYVNFEDIDRACRNDAGSYLPFAGNFQYMDLMGTYIYGVVMKDMNPDLSRQTHVPTFFKTMMKEGRLGMDTRHGFYDYSTAEVEKWNRLARKFSYEIKDIMQKYQEVI